MLLPQHQKLIADSAISQEVADARGYFSVETKKALKDLGFAESQCRVPALVIPIRNVTGELILHQVRPDDPRYGKDGRVIRYELPKDAHLALDVPTAARGQLSKPNRPLFITEGSRKADSAVSHGLCCIAVLGVNGWRGSREDGALLVLPDWEEINLKNREILLIFDSDVMLKRPVH